MAIKTGTNYKKACTKRMINIQDIMSLTKRLRTTAWRYE